MIVLLPVCQYFVNRNVCGMTDKIGGIDFHFLMFSYWERREEYKISKKLELTKDLYCQMRFTQVFYSCLSIVEREVQVREAQQERLCRLITVTVIVLSFRHFLLHGRKLHADVASRSSEEIKKRANIDLFTFNNEQYKLKWEGTGKKGNEIKFFNFSELFSISHTY